MSPGLWAACRTEGRARRGAKTRKEAAPNHQQGPGLQTTGRHPGQAKLSAEDQNVTDELAFKDPVVIPLGTEGGGQRETASQALST